MSIKRSVSVTMICAALMLFTAQQASAQSTRDRVTMLEQQIVRLDRVITNNNDRQIKMLRDWQELQSENQTLRNEIEKLQFEAEQGAKRQRQLYLDLDQRIEAVSEDSAVTADALTEATRGGMIVADGALVSKSTTSSADADYQAAFELVKELKYQQAGVSFERFLVLHADSNLRVNAEYWLGEISYAQADFSAALEVFQRLIKNHPASRKIPGAWLKVGFCQYELNRWAEARQALNIVVTQFPETTAARLAQERLDKISAEGR
jgi:tol-pal system protein YbgF